MQNLTYTQFTEALAAKTSVPGGGGASALAGAIGVALGSMVGNFTLGKKKYAEVEPEIKELMAKAEDIRVGLLNEIAHDAEAFEPLSRAYGIPKDDPTRGEVMEKCLRDAASVPMAIARLCCEAIELQREFGAKGSTIMISDAATGAIILAGALKGAAMNVRVNTKLMADRDYAKALDDEIEALVAKYWPMANEVFDGIYGE